MDKEHVDNVPAANPVSVRTMTSAFKLETWYVENEDRVKRMRPPSNTVLRPIRSDNGPANNAKTAAANE